MTARGRRTALAVGASALVLGVGAAALIAWSPSPDPKDLEPAPVAETMPSAPMEAVADRLAAREQLPAELALAAAQAQTLALTDEVARLRWLALSQRRQCVPAPPPEPVVAEAPPPPPPPVEEEEPAVEPPPEEPVVVAVAPPPPPLPTLTPARDAPPPPPPPPPEPEPPQVAAVPPPQPPQPPAPPQPSSTEFDQRIQREGGQQSGQLVTLIWNNTNDLDLHVVCPDGTRVYFANIAGCGSQLDIDMNASTNWLSSAPVENIVWPGGLPRGRYQVYVDHYANHGSHDPTPFRVRVRVAGEERVFNGSIRHGEPARYITDFYIN